MTKYAKYGNISVTDPTKGMQAAVGSIMDRRLKEDILAKEEARRAVEAERAERGLQLREAAAEREAGKYKTALAEKKALQEYVTGYTPYGEEAGGRKGMELVDKAVLGKIEEMDRPLTYEEAADVQTFYEKQVPWKEEALSSVSKNLLARGVDPKTALVTAATLTEGLKSKEEARKEEVATTKLLNERADKAAKVEREIARLMKTAAGKGKAGRKGNGTTALDISSLVEKQDLGWYDTDKAQTAVDEALEIADAKSVKKAIGYGITHGYFAKGFDPVKFRAAVNMFEEKGVEGTTGTPSLGTLDKFRPRSFQPEPIKDMTAEEKLAEARKEVRWLGEEEKAKPAAKVPAKLAPPAKEVDEKKTAEVKVGDVSDASKAFEKYKGPSLFGKDTQALTIPAKWGTRKMPVQTETERLQVEKALGDAPIEDVSLALVPAGAGAKVAGKAVTSATGKAFGKILDKLTGTLRGGTFTTKAASGRVLSGGSASAAKKAFNKQLTDEIAVMASKARLDVGDVSRLEAIAKRIPALKKDIDMLINTMK